jgi:type IV secretory pathway VirB10-like protein
VRKALGSQGGRPGPAAAPGPPVTFPYTDQKRLLGIAGIALAAVALLYIAFSGGPENPEDPKTAVNTKQPPDVKEPDPQPKKLPDIKKPPDIKKVPDPVIPPDPTAGDPTSDSVGDTAGPEPKKLIPVKPKADPNSDACKSTREKVTRARDEGKWHDMNRLLNERECWKSKPEHAKLRTKAYMELGKFKDCAKSGKGSSDPDVVKWVRLCERRSESG